MEDNHSEEWEQHLDYLQKEANGHKGQSVISFKLQFQLIIYRCFSIKHYY